jgi:uncharacterized protein YeaO (DUF488 family)
MARQIKTKLIYDPAAPADGTRVLVDRIWPRGIRKDEAESVVWLKEIAPSTALRQWFGHWPERWKRFLQRYARELDSNRRAVARLRGLMKNGRATLPFAARNQRQRDPCEKLGLDHINAAALARYLHGRKS